MKYCITITLRTCSPCFVKSVYKEFLTIKSLNDFIFSEICNSKSSYEIVGLYFEVVDYD